MHSFMDTQRKIERGVVAGYKRIEESVVSGYKKMEDGIVSGYKKIERGFVNTFLADDTDRSDEPAPDARQE